MTRKFAKKIVTLLVMIMLAFLLVAMIDTKIKRRTFDYNVQNTYESMSKTVSFSPLDKMGINHELIEIRLDGDVQISTDENNVNTKFVNPKYKFKFIGLIKFGTYEINFEANNPLVSTEIILKSKWVTYASNIDLKTSKIDNKLYFLGATLIHENDYTIKTISLDVYDASKVLIGKFVFNIESNE